MKSWEQSSGDGADCAHLRAVGVVGSHISRARNRCEEHAAVPACRHVMGEEGAALTMVQPAARAPTQTLSDAVSRRSFHVCFASWSKMSPCHLLLVSTNACSVRQ